MFQCKDLLALPSMGKARVLSGKNGLEKGIRWVYKPESMEFSKWVKGRELLIISTPVITSPDFNLEKLIEEAVKLNISGALLLVGEHYISKISKKIITFTDAMSFPLFVMSGEIPLINLFEEIGHAIAYHENTDSRSEDILSSIIFGNVVDIDALLMKSQKIGYDITPPQQIFMVHMSAKSSMTMFDREGIYDDIKDLFEAENIPIVLSQYGNNFVGMFQVFSNLRERMEHIFSVLSNKVTEEYLDVELVISVGKAYQRLEMLQESFHEASRTIVIMNKRGTMTGLFFYEDLGFINLLYQLEGNRQLGDFIEQSIGKVLAYDKENNTELLLTLKTYLECDGSLLHAAEKLHTHRNTVKYRIQRIEEILGKKINDFYTKMELMNGILSYEIHEAEH